MGYYINPIAGTKEEWLEQYGQITQEPDWPPPDGQVLVCLVDNGMVITDKNRLYFSKNSEYKIWED